MPIASARRGLAATIALLLPCTLLPAHARPDGATADMEMEMETQTLQRVIVTADPLGGRGADDFTRPVTVLSEDALDRRQAGTIGEVLSGLPGVANSDFGPGVGRPVVRGQQGSGVLVLEDGLRTADVSGEGADHAVAIDTRRAEQIEIFRGPATLLYGGGAAGGVINVRTGRFSPVIPVTTLGRVEAGYGGNGHDRNAGLRLEHPLADGVVLRGDYSQRRSGDFSIEGLQQTDQEVGFRGRLQNSAIRSDAASLTGLASRDWGYLGLGASTWNSDYGVPEVFDPQRLRGDGTDDFERITAGFNRADLRGEVYQPFAGIDAIRFKAAYTRFEQQETEFEFSRDDGSFEASTVEAEFLNKEFESRLDLVHAAIAGWRGVVGLQLGDRDFAANDPDSESQTFYVRPNRTRKIALFLLEERETEWGRIELGARIERERSDPDDVTGVDIAGVTLADGSFLPLPERLDARHSTPVSLSAGTVWNLCDARRLRASLSRSQRSPSPEQLYAFGRHPAAGTFEIGNPDLGKETYLHLESGVEGTVGRFSYEFTVFRTRADGYVTLASEDDGSGAPVFVNDIGQRPGEGYTAACGPEDGGLCRFRNQFVVNAQDDALFYGAELAASVALREGPVPVTLRASADRVRGRLADGGDLPRITPARYGLGIDAGWRDVILAVDVQRVSNQSRVAEAETTTDGFTLLSFDASWSRPTGGLDTTWFVKGRNLYNEAGRLHQSFYKDEAPIIGRSFTLGVRVDFGG